MSRCDSDEATKDGYEDDPVELPFLNSLSEAITCLGGICNFLKNRGYIYTTKANNLNALLDCLAKPYCTPQTMQTCNSEYSYSSWLQNT